MRITRGNQDAAVAMIAADPAATGGAHVPADLVPQAAHVQEVQAVPGPAADLVRAVPEARAPAVQDHGAKEIAGMDRAVRRDVATTTADTSVIAHRASSHPHLQRLK